MDRMKRILIDLDETISAEQVVTGKEAAQPGASKAISRLKEKGYQIYIFTSQLSPESKEDPKDTMKRITTWLDTNKIPYDKVTNNKYAAGFYVDDRALTFTTWSNILSQIDREPNEKRKFLVLDSCLFVEQANALSNGGKNRVLYWTNWESSDPDFVEYAYGLGFENIEKVKYLGEALDQLDKKKDIIVNFDVGRNDLIVWLRKQGYKCVGSGAAQVLEQERWKMKKILQAAGLRINHCVLIKGCANLRIYLRDNKDKFIKHDTFRKDMESFYAKDLESVDSIIADRERTLGPFKDTFEWIVEDAIHTDLEFGVDTFFAGGDYCKPYLLGIEFEKDCYLAKIVEELPPVLKETMDKMRPVFAKMDYRGPMSTEEKIVSEKEHYFLDFCARLFHPGSALYTEAIRNWADALTAMANGKNVRLDIREKYWGAIPLSTTYAKEHWVPIDFPPEIRKYIKFGTPSGVNKKYYGTRGAEVVGVCVAGGNSIDEVVNKLKKYAKEVNAYGLTTASMNGINKIAEIAANGKKVGIDF